MDRHQIEAFARRHWQLTSQSKTAYWAEQFRRDPQRRRFHRRITDPRFTEKTRVIPLVHLPTQLPIDVVLAGPRTLRM